MIELRKDPKRSAGIADWGKQKYSSAKIFTKDKFAFAGGFIEVSAKLPCARGTWPAIWMLPQNDSRWPDGGEIDIIEQVGSQPNVAHATLHTALFNHTHGNGRGAETAVPTACSAFHRYQLAWTPDAITIGVDDRAYMRVRNDQPGGRGAWPFDSPFYLILNLAMGGDWAAAKGSTMPLCRSVLKWTMCGFGNCRRQTSSQAVSGSPCAFSPSAMKARRCRSSSPL